MENKNNNISKVGIPIWINIISVIVLAILIFQVYACFFNPSLAYGKFENNDSNRQAILTLAGRNVVMILITFLALKSQKVKILMLVFLMNILRETYDMILVGYLDHFSMKSFGMMSSFLVFLIPYVLALKKLRKLAHPLV